MKFIVPIVLAFFISSCGKSASIEIKDNAINVSALDKVYDGQPVSPNATALSGEQVAIKAL